MAALLCACWAIGRFSLSLPFYFFSLSILLSSQRFVFYFFTRLVLCGWLDRVIILSKMQRAQKRSCCCPPCYCIHQHNPKGDGICPAGVAWDDRRSNRVTRSSRVFVALGTWEIQISSRSQIRFPLCQFRPESERERERELRECRGQCPMILECNEIWRAESKNSNDGFWC